MSALLSAATLTLRPGKPAAPPLRALHVAAEVFPLVKTGGLADVLGALPQALIGAGVDTRLLLPGYPAIIDAVLHQKTLCQLGPLFGASRISLRLGRMPYSKVPVYVIDAPYLYRRDGGPYQSRDGHEWPDNPQRFALLGWVAAHLAAGELDPEWVPNIMQAHDWHAAMSCAYVAMHPPTRTATVFTVHNLAYQGLFPSGDFHLLGLPSRAMASHGLEFHGQLSFMKAGLKFAHHITTVSPTYATEIASREFGCGLEGVIQGRHGDVSGILNGVDGAVWNPATDPALPVRYDAADLSGKARCKAALQRQLGLAESPTAMLFGVVSRLTAQKGLDLLLDALPALLAQGAQLVLQGSGEPALESAFLAAARSHPQQVAVRIGYDENFAHSLIAAADSVMVPSRFEPCGLTQLYALRYGSVPLVRRVGGLADTVVDASEAALASQQATGLVFEVATPSALAMAVERAVRLFRQPEVWRGLVRQSMAQDFSWDGAARRYLGLYQRLVAAQQVG